MKASGKRLLSVIMAFTLLFSLVSLTALAEDGEISGGGTTTTKWDGTIDTSWYNSSDQLWRRRLH